MTPALFLQIAIRPALSLLPKEMNSPAAIAMLLSIALQESKLEHRHQVGGPAHGVFQFERGGGVLGVLSHKTTKPIIEPLCELLLYKPTSVICFAAIEHNDVLATVFARLLLWTLPAPLPSRTETQTSWEQYLDAWRPGRPHVETWDDNYSEAWDLVERD